MTQNNNLTPLAWYTDKKYQNHRKSFAYGKVFDLITPTRKLLPFQIVRKERVQQISSVKLWNKDDTLFMDITVQIKETGLIVKNYNSLDVDVIIYPGLLPMAIEMPEGQYYCSITDGVETWYSEVFTSVVNVEGYVLLEWRCKHDLYYSGGLVSYESPKYKNMVYLKTEIGKPRYDFVEEGEDRDGYFFPEKQVSEKTFKFTVLAPEYLADAMRLVRLNDYIRVHSDGRTYEIDTFLMSEKWQTQGDIASLEIEFQTDTVVKKLGESIIPEDIGDFNPDFNWDFDDIQTNPEECSLTVAATLTTINVGQSTILSYTGCTDGTVTWDNGVGTGNNKTVSPTVTTVYTATCDNGDGCSASITINVVNPESDWQNEKYLPLMVSFPFDGGNTTAYEATVNDWLATYPDIDSLTVPIFVGDVFESYNTTGRRQDQNLDTSWQYRLDPLILFLKDKNVKVNFMICTFLATFGGQVNKFWGQTNNERDEWNNAVELEYGNAHPSLADNSTNSGKNMMKDFVKKVVARYIDEDFLGENLGWVTPVITGQMEYGYNFATGSSGSGVPIFEGYHPVTIAGFKTWLQSPSNPNRYVNIETLNAKWGTAFATFDVVEPPRTGKGNRLATDADYVAMFATNWGKDWWKYHESLLYNFANELRTAILEIAPQVKFVLSFGGISPNDGLVLRRVAYDAKRWNEVSDGLKTAIGMDTRVGFDKVSITLDYIQNYGKKKQTELKYGDFTNELSPEAPSVIKPRIIAYGKKAIENGVKDLMFLTMGSDGVYNTMMKEIYGELSAYMAGTYTRTTVGSATVSLDELIGSGGQIGIDKWLGAGGSNSARVNLTLTNNSTPVSGFTDWEINQLPALVSGQNDVVSLQTLGFEVFPDASTIGALNGFVLKYFWGDFPEFQNHSGDIPPIALSKGLATGFDNGFLNTTVGVSGVHRYKWDLPGSADYFAFWSQSHAQLEVDGGAYWISTKSKSLDSNGVAVMPMYTMLDIEAGVTDFTKIEAFVKGYYNAARADVPNHTLIIYSYNPTQGFTYFKNGYYYDGDSAGFREKFFPYSKHSYNETKAKVSKGIISNWWKGKDILYNIFVQYSKANLPLTSTMYQTVGGVIQYDTDGQRLFRQDEFTETIRGKTYRWHAAGTPDQISPEEANEYADYRLLPEVYYGVHQFGGFYSEIFFRLRMLSNMQGLGDDIQNLHNQATPFGTTGIRRFDLEAEPRTNDYRPEDRINTQWHASMIFCLLNNFTWFSGLTGGNIGLTKTGAYIEGVFYPGSNVTVNEGLPFGTPWYGDEDEEYSGHLGNARQVGAIWRQCAAENRVYGLWQKTDKILTLCHPEQIINGQFPLIGRLQGKYLKLFGIEARLEIGESFTLSIKNTKNGTIFTRQVLSKKVLDEVIILPDNTYNAQDIYVEYNNPVKAGIIRVNGKAESL